MVNTGDFITAGQWNTVASAEETFRNADNIAIIGTAPPTTTRKVRMEFSVLAVTTPGGFTTIPFPSNFPHGITYLSAVPGDAANNLGHLTTVLTGCFLYQWNGVAYTHLGVALAAGLTIRVHVVAVGW